MLESDWCWLCEGSEREDASTSSTQTVSVLTQLEEGHLRTAPWCWPVSIFRSVCRFMSRYVLFAGWDRLKEHLLVFICLQDVTWGGCCEVFSGKPSCCCAGFYILCHCRQNIFEFWAVSLWKGLMRIFPSFLTFTRIINYRVSEKVIDRFVKVIISSLDSILLCDSQFHFCFK